MTVCELSFIDMIALKKIWFLIRISNNYYSNSGNQFNAK